MLKLTRSDALARVKALRAKPKAIAWGLVWGFTVEEMAAALQIKPVTVEKHIADLCKEWNCGPASIALILILAEGIRIPDLAEWPGINTNTIYPQGEVNGDDVHGDDSSRGHEERCGDPGPSCAERSEISDGSI